MNYYQLKTLYSKVEDLKQNFVHKNINLKF